MFLRARSANPRARYKRPQKAEIAELIGVGKVKKTKLPSKNSKRMGSRSQPVGEPATGTVADAAAKEPSRYNTRVYGYYAGALGTKDILLCIEAQHARCRERERERVLNLIEHYGQ